MLGEDTNNPGEKMGIREGMPVVPQPKRRRESLDVNLMTPQMNKLTLMVGDERRASLLGVETIQEVCEKRGGGDVSVFFG